MNKKHTPPALHYAEVLENFYMGLGRLDATGAAAELRGLHAANAELLAALQSSTHGLHPADADGPCLCGQCQFVRLRDTAIAKATGGAA